MEAEVTLSMAEEGRQKYRVFPPNGVSKNEGK